MSLEPFAASLVVAANPLAGFRTESALPVAALPLPWLIGGGIGLGLAIAVAVAITLSRKPKGKRLYDHHELFESLCRLHELDRKSRRLLCEIAAYHRLAHPARLFLERKWLFPMNLNQELKARSAELAALRRQLFYSPKPKPERGK